MSKELYAYRIRLKGTNLYWQPVKGYFAGEKSNLGFKGKVYLSKPILGSRSGVYISNSLYNKHPTLNLQDGKEWHRGQRILSNEYEFEIIKYKLVEVG